MYYSINIKKRGENRQRKENFTRQKCTFTAETIAFAQK